MPPKLKLRGLANEYRGNICTKANQFFFYSDSEMYGVIVIHYTSVTMPLSLTYLGQWQR